MKLPKVIIAAGVYFIFAFSPGLFAQEASRYGKEEQLQKANEYWLAGKRFLAQGNYGAADAEFKKAQGLLPAAIKEESPGPAVWPNQDPQAKKENDAAKLSLPEANPTEAKKPSPQINGSKESSPQDIISLYRRAAELIPGNSHLYYNLAVGYLKAKQYPEASGALRKAIQINPKDKEACYNLAVLYDSYLNDKKQALFYYGRYLGLSPKAEDAQEVRAWMRQINKELKTNE